MTNANGLTDSEVADRQSRGLTNRVGDGSSRTLRDILRANVLTPFNALITTLAIVTLLVNQNPINSLFFIAMLLNIIVGVVQELRARATLDRLAIMVKPRARVRRNGTDQEIDSADVVQDDIVKLELGDQIVVDGLVVSAAGLEIDESLLTGESDPIAKQPGDMVLSGSIVISGQGLIRAIGVGQSSYAARLASEAKQFKRASSELIAATNTIMKWIARLMLVVVPILVIGQLRTSGGDWREVVLHTVAAIVGMIPEGLVLLTSMAFMVAVMKLARQSVLVQQLPAVETLARVNMLLLDKTGTITDGKMQFTQLINLTSGDVASLETALATMARRASSPTNLALATAFMHPAKFTREVAFSSARKWSAIELSNGARYVLGAPEVVLAQSSQAEMLGRAQTIAVDGKRVLLLAKVADWPVDDKLSGAVEPLALVVLAERIRSDAADTLAYFADQGVIIKIISGDSPRTVAAVAERLGLLVQAIDARELPDPAQKPAEFLQLVQSHNIFGRVKPEQKRQIAAALQSAGDVVAMTGDGVNDALALKKADLGIAMSSGAAATRAVAEVVLLDNRFSHLPAVLAEGRRVVANIERVSNLFIIKNVYTAILALAVTALGLAYPFLPAQMTVLGGLSIGIPAFFLALAPNYRRYQPGFLWRVMRFAIPTGLITAAAMIICYYSIDSRNMPLAVAGTSVSVTAMVIGLAVLLYLAWPLNWWRCLLVLACGAAFAIYLTWPPLASIFSLNLVPATLPMALIIAAVAIVAAIAAQWLLKRLAHRPRPS